MGYNLTIGNAVPDMPTRAQVDGDETRTPRWTVRAVTAPDAPMFLGESEACSERSPSYSGWAQFCRDTGLSSLFYGATRHARSDGIAERETCLIQEHPGVALLRASDLDEVRAAIASWRARPWPTEERIAGWDPTLEPFSEAKPDPRYDGHLARLLWLEFWIEWALRNCEHPALENT